MVHRLALLTEDNLKALGVESLGYRIELMVNNSILQLVCLFVCLFAIYRYTCKILTCKARKPREVTKGLFKGMPYRYLRLNKRVKMLSTAHDLE